MKTLEKVIACLLFLVLIGTSGFANDWQFYWENAVQSFEKEQYAQAENEINAAVFGLEDSGDDSHPHVYVDRARLYMAQDRYSEALSDLNRVFDSPYLTGSDKVNAIVTRLYAHVSLGMEKEVLEDSKIFREIYPSLPKWEISEEKIIIRNTPSDTCYRVQHGHCQIMRDKIFAAVSSLCNSSARDFGKRKKLPLFSF